MACDALVRVDGNEVGIFRLNAETAKVFERPVEQEGKFTFFELGTGAATRAGLKAGKDLGLVQVMFMPELLSKKVEVYDDLVLYSSPDIPWSDGDLDNLEDSSRASLGSGGTGLTGRSEQEFYNVEAIEHVEEDDFITISIRLGSLRRGIVPLQDKCSSGNTVPPPLS